MNQECLVRIRKLQAEMAAADVDAVFLYTDVNRLYFTGLKTSNGLLLVERRGTPTFFTDFRYMEVAKRTLTDLSVVKFGTAARQMELYATLSRNWKTIGYEGTLDVNRFMPLYSAFSSFKWQNMDKLIYRVRSIKSASEIDALRTSAAANDAHLADMLTKFRPGMTELEMLTLFRTANVANGNTESFDPIICAGVNAVECHHRPDGTVLMPESELLIDMGVTVGDYCSDMTRTVYYGTPTARFKEIFDIVEEANLACRDAIKPGVRCCDIDKIARDIIGRYGYGDYFDHGLGHAVGIEIHEYPRFSRGDETVLEPGMVLTDEPGIYIPGDTGVRIEDILVVTDTGCEVMSKSPHRIVIPC